MLHLLNSEDGDGALLENILLVQEADLQLSNNSLASYVHKAQVLANE